MKISRRQFSAALLAALAFPQAVRANEKIMKIVVGSPPGGTTDIMGRLAARSLGQALGMNGLVENRSGAAGMIGASYVAKTSPADGLVLLMSSASHATIDFLYKNVPYDSHADFQPVVLMAKTPYVLVAHPGLGVETLDALIDKVKQAPGEFSFASSGNGNVQHLAGERLKALAGLDMLHIPYKGSAEAIPDVLSGRVPIMFDNVALMGGHIKNKSLIPIAVTSAERVSVLPDVPTFAEAGIDGMALIGWFALWAPAGVDEPLIRQINDAANEVLARPDVRATLSEMGSTPGGGSPADLAAFYAQQRTVFADVIEAAKIRL